LAAPNRASIIFTNYINELNEMPNRSKRTEKIQIMLDDQELATIDDWRFENRVPSRAAAIRELIRRGLITNEDIAPPANTTSSGDFRVTDDEEGGDS
jgi:metal-responsive CopG/Arc/MetJ family transcriptional regulator